MPHIAGHDFDVDWSGGITTMPGVADTAAQIARDQEGIRGAYNRAMYQGLQAQNAAHLFFNPQYRQRMNQSFNPMWSAFQIHAANTAQPGVPQDWSQSFADWIGSGSPLDIGTGAVPTQQSLREYLRQKAATSPQGDTLWSAYGPSVWQGFQDLVTYNPYSDPISMAQQSLRDRQLEQQQYSADPSIYPYRDWFYGSPVTDLQTWQEGIGGPPPSGTGTHSHADGSASHAAHPGSDQSHGHRTNLEGQAKFFDGSPKPLDWDMWDLARQRYYLEDQGWADEDINTEVGAPVQNLNPGPPNNVDYITREIRNLQGFKVMHWPNQVNMDLYKDLQAKINASYAGYIQPNDLIEATATFKDNPAALEAYAATRIEGMSHDQALLDGFSAGGF